jgi:hypothetical protein
LVPRSFLITDSLSNAEHLRNFGYEVYDIEISCYPFGFGFLKVIMVEGNASTGKTVLEDICYRLKYHFTPTPVWANEGLIIPEGKILSRRDGELIEIKDIQKWCALLSPLNKN